MRGILERTMWALRNAPVVFYAPCVPETPTGARSVDQSYGTWRSRIDSLMCLKVITIVDVIDVISPELPAISAV
jgi:hypothetical protein